MSARLTLGIAVLLRESLWEMTFMKLGKEEE